MATTIFTSSAPSSASGKRKRDDFVQTLQRQDHGQNSSATTIGGLSLRGETNLRTMKRLRNKPVEREVHEYTLQKLFCAQSTKQTIQQSLVPALDTPALPKPQFRSMSSVFASFFTSTKPHPTPNPKQNNLVPPPVQSPSIPICEDCDRPLQERELYLSGEGTCLNCRRTVCSEGGCSVAVNDGWGGEGRVCLECALR